MTDQRTKNTEEFLKLLSYRLSGRTELSKVNYNVHISIGNKIRMSPVVYVYPNRYRRCETDKIDAVSFILSTFIGKDSRKFVPGDYLYQSSIDNRRRKWIKIK